MAKMKRNIGELVSGRIGNVVFYTRNGVNYVRAVPDRKKDSWSPQQMLHRQRFSKASFLWSQLKKTKVAPIWNLAAERMNGYAMFMKANMPAYALDGSIIDSKMLKISTGKLHLPMDLEASLESAGSSAIAVSWKNDPNMKGKRLEDELMAVSATDGHYSAMTPTGLLRSAQGGTFTLPEKPTDATHVYLFFASQDGLDYTESVCIELGTN
jgi:hypothetical protein